MIEKQRAPRNRTILLTETEKKVYGRKLRRIDGSVSLSELLDSTICQDLFEVMHHLPTAVFDLIFADSPYNMTKEFNGTTFRQTDMDSYEKWLESWLPAMRRLLKPTGAIYVCGDWCSSTAIHRVLAKHFKVRNRITWEREKGRGARTNWKNNSEDIWFGTKSDNYTFDVDKVKVKRRVIAPYTDENGVPRDWAISHKGRYRLTYPSNLWTDLTIPFWSMPENTDHPTQKPEKLLAKIILASSNVDDVVFDPFLGSGTTSVVAKKLGRHYVGVEIDREYCCLAEKRLEMAEADRRIQGYSNGTFWERNTFSEQIDSIANPLVNRDQMPSLFDLTIKRNKR